MNTRNRSVAIALTMATLPLAGGCMWAPELADVKQDIARQLPGVGFHKNVTLSFGPLTMVLARTITGFIPEAREARQYLRDVSKLQVAVYEMDGTPESGSLKTPDYLQELMDKGWEMAVRVNDEGDRVWLLFRLDDDSVREMFVVTMSDDELVMVKIKGRLERVMAEAIQNMDDDGGLLHGGSGIHIGSAP